VCSKKGADSQTNRRTLYTFKELGYQKVKKGVLFFGPPEYLKQIKCFLSGSSHAKALHAAHVQH
jgi:hypothetical protein